MPLTDQEANARRMERLFAIVEPCPFGSLWRVPEHLWKNGLMAQNRRYDYGNDRANHPGCCVRINTASLGAVPMLLGTSNRGGVCIKNAYGEPHATYFGQLPPVPFDISCWQGTHRIQAAGKGCATQSEKKGLRAFLKRKGWI